MMARTLRKVLLAAVATAACMTSAPGPDTLPSPAKTNPADLLSPRVKRAELLFLGTFHFDDPGLDAYQPRFKLDVTAPARQRELELLVKRLASFRPTKIAVEVKRGAQARLDSLYSEYLRGTREFGPNEIYQIGFRLAKLLGLPRVYAVEAEARSYLNDEQIRAKMDALGVDLKTLMQRIQNDPWTSRYRLLYARDDSLKTVRTISEQLLYMNRQERIRVGHGAYLVGSFKLGAELDYLGPDDATSWYNRNLRIFSNLQSITSDGDRILLVIGAGHLPILRFLAQSSPEHRLREVADFVPKS